jgi:hypothetical protein
MYGTLAELRQKLDKVEAGAAIDTALTALLTNATAMVRQVLRAGIANPTFDFAAPASSTKIVRSYGGVFLSVPVHAANSITLVEAMSGTNPVAYTEITDEWVEDETGLIYRPVGWPIDGRYRVTADWGHGAVPDDIKEITLELAVNLWRSKDKGSFTEIIGAEGGGAVAVVGALTTKQREQLKAWTDLYRGVEL